MWDQAQLTRTILTTFFLFLLLFNKGGGVIVTPKETHFMGRDWRGLIFYKGRDS